MTTIHRLCGVYSYQCFQINIFPGERYVLATVSSSTFIYITFNALGAICFPFKKYIQMLGNDQALLLVCVSRFTVPCI